MNDRRVVFIHQDNDPPAGGQRDEEFAEFIAGGNRVQFDSIPCADFGNALGEGFFEAALLEVDILER